jgi:tRNA uridine 5-carboxymethylaminomethyl modification enzyme
VGTTLPPSGISLAELLKRPQVTYELIAPVDKKREPLPTAVTKEVETDLKYEGYLKLEKEKIEKFAQLERRLLPEDTDYEKISGLRLEARQKLNSIRPLNIGQASRISGVSPADISVLLVYTEMLKRKDKEEDSENA